MSVFKEMRPADLGKHIFVANRSGKKLARAVMRSLMSVVQKPDKPFAKLQNLVVHSFADSEMNVVGQFGDISPTKNDDEDDTFRGSIAHLFTSFRQEAPDACAAVDIWELFLTLDMLMNSGVKEINLVYFCQIGQRMHKKVPHQPFTAALALRLAQAAAGGAHILRNIMIIHPHNQTSQGFVEGTKVDDFLPVAATVNYLKSNPSINGKKIIVVATDAGAKAYAEYVANDLGVESLVVMNKDRKGLKRPESFVASGLQWIDGDPDAVYIICDDIVSSGETAENAKDDIEKIVGHPITTYLFATHGCFNKKGKETAEDRLRRIGMHAVVSDTIPRSKKYVKENSDIITFYSLAPYIAELIICDILGKSTGVIIRRQIARAQMGLPSINEILLNNELAPL